VWYHLSDVSPEGQTVTRLSALVRVLFAAVCLLGGDWCPGASASAEPPVFSTRFNNSAELSKWQGGGGKLTTARGGMCLLIESSDKNASPRRTIRLPVKRIAGKLITIRAAVKAGDVSKPPKPWNGIKVMLVVESGSQRLYPQINLPQGTFGWKNVSRSIRLPADISGATLVLGLEQVAGKVWFDDVQVTLGRAVSGGRKLTTPFKGHNLPRLRGVMHGPTFDAKNIRDLAAWGANHVRWQLNWVPMKAAEQWAKDLDRYDRWLDDALKHADKAIDACEKHGIRVLLDLHCPPGGRSEGGVCRMFSEKRYQQKFLDVWKRLATRYRNRKIIYAYDLINEPVELRVRPDGLLGWRQLATEAAGIIRKIEPGKPIVFEPGPWGSCRGFDEMVPLEIDRVIYSFHMYQPHVFTHQFRSTKEFPKGIEYPGTIRGVKWDKARLRAAMAPAIDFQREFNVHVYVGEFSAIRWAPNFSAHRYIRDLIELFEAEGWDWSYHAYREWNGWSVEHTTDRSDTTPAKMPTRRQKLLQQYFAKNKQPGDAIAAAVNKSCLRCHQNYRIEPLALVHARSRVGCISCHGKSAAHIRDDKKLRPPDVMYVDSAIDPSCSECHEDHNVPPAKVIARWRQRCPEKTDPTKITCTDCHGDHRLGVRKVRWDPKTRKLIFDKRPAKPAATQPAR